MRRVIITVVAATLGALVGCFGLGKVTDPGGTATNNTSNRTMTVTANGVTYSPTLLTSAYLNNQVAVNAEDGSRSLAINAINVTGPGTFSVAPGNANSAIVTWIDANGNYSSGFTGGTGTVTFTTLVLGHVAGSFSVTVHNSNSGAIPTVTLAGTFDIPFP